MKMIMGQREIKFRIIDSSTNKVIGYETWDITFGWCFVIIPVDTVRAGVFPDGINRNIRNQSTGLFDKNGKEIYEGDIVRIMTPENQIQKKSIISEIGFHDHAFCAYWRKTELWEGFSISPSPVYYLNSLIAGDRIEIIGNIYENPELLK